MPGATQTGAARPKGCHLAPAPVGRPATTSLSTRPGGTVTTHGHNAAGAPFSGTEHEPLASPFFASAGPGADNPTRNAGADFIPPNGAPRNHGDEIANLLAEHDARRAGGVA